MGGQSTRNFFVYPLTRGPGIVLAADCARSIFCTRWRRRPRVTTRRHEKR